MTMDREKEREKEREIELESAMYTNCLLLGLDPVIIGIGATSGTPRVGHFRHSNPKLGEQLLHFILSSIRGPIQSAKVRFLYLLSRAFASDPFPFSLTHVKYFRTLTRFGRFSIRRNRVIFER